MSKEFFSEIFRLFAEYEHDLTIYCHDDMTHNWECEMPDKKKLSDSDRQLLKHIVKVLGVNYNSKLAKLYNAFETFVETGEGTIKIKLPDGVVEMVPIKTLVGGGFFGSLLGSKKTRTPEQQAAHKAKKLARTPEQQAAHKAKKKTASYKIKKFVKGASRHIGTAMELAQQASEAMGQSAEPEIDPDTGRQLPQQKRTSPLMGLLGSTSVIQKLQKIIANIDALTSGNINVQTLLEHKPMPDIINGLNEPTLRELEKMNQLLIQINDTLQKSRVCKPLPPATRRQPMSRNEEVDIPPPPLPRDTPQDRRYESGDV